ncbi:MULTISPECIES: hypothetical protein [Flavobacteriaceae]|nr:MULTISPECIES: hypothetical protein [Flavobacteriaceae]NJB38178.1 hypothetical protein [Croceivirga sp. JEA036]
MKKKTPYMIERPLADMHADGVRFDVSIIEALRNQQTIAETKYRKENNAQ